MAACAVGSAVFASLTSILGKIGIQDVNSNLGTAIRTAVVLVMKWIVVFVTGKQNTVNNIDEKAGCSLFFRSCNRRFLAMLLQSTSDRSGQCGSSD